MNDFASFPNSQNNLDVQYSYRKGQNQNLQNSQVFTEQKQLQNDKINQRAQSYSDFLNDQSIKFQYHSNLNHSKPNNTQQLQHKSIMETINEQNFQKNNNLTKKLQNDEDQTFQLTSICEQNYNKIENNINISQKLNSIQKRKNSQSKLKLPFISPRESTRSIGGNKFFKFDTEQLIQQYKKEQKQQQESQEKKCTTEELNIKESYLARISTPITDLPVQSDNLNDDLYDLLNQQNKQDKKVLPARIITQQVDYYKNFKNLQRQNEKSTQYGLKPDLKQSILKPCLKNQTLLPKKLGLTFENLKFQKKFTFQNQNLEQKYIPMITQALKHDQLQKLEDFKLINNNIKRKPENLSKIIQALPKGTKEIQLQKNGINFNMTKILQPLLEGDIYSNLKVVNLSNNNLEDKGANQILFYMLDNSSIQSLDLSANGITDKVIPSLKNLLQKSNYLNELYLSWNNITAIGGYQIATALEKNIELAVLDLSYNSLCHNNQKNQFAGVEIVKTITESVRSQMKHLDLSYNNLTKQEGQLINKIMKENKNVYGFHFEGNSGAFVNARQYIDFVDEIELKQKQKKQESLNLLKKQTNNHKSKAKAFLLQKIQENTQKDFNINKQKIKSVKPLPLREGQVNLDSYNDICWICQGWHEVKFEFEFNVDDQNCNDDKNNHIFVHLDFEGNQPILMEKQGNIYVSYRMCPPNRKINFFFSNPITDAIAINDKYEKQRNTNFKDQLGQILEYPNGQKRLIEEPRTFNLQLPQKQMQIIDENSYEAKVKAQPRNNGYEEEFEIVPEWQFSQSIMYPWKPETEENLIQSFETDIQCSKIKKICKDEDDFEQIKDLLFQNYKQLRFLYKYLSSLQLNGNLFSISLNTITDFIQQMKNIQDNVTLNLSDIDVNFITTNQVSEKSEYNPDRAMVRYQFMEFLLRIASDKYMKNGQSVNLTSSFLRLLEDGLQEFISNSEDLQMWRETRYWNKECDGILQKEKQLLLKIYNKYAGSQQEKQKKFSNVKCLLNTEYRQFWNDLGVYDELFSERDPLIIFSISMMPQIDELDNPKFMQMNFVEFLEAVSRSAEKLSPIHIEDNPTDWEREERIQQPLHHKIQNLISIINDKFEKLQNQQKNQSTQNTIQSNQPGQIIQSEIRQNSVLNNIDIPIQQQNQDLIQILIAQNRSNKQQKKKKTQIQIYLSKEELDNIYENYEQIYKVKKSPLLLNISKMDKNEDHKNQLLLQQQQQLILQKRGAKRFQTMLTKSKIQNNSQRKLQSQNSLITPKNSKTDTKFEKNQGYYENEIMYPN